MRTWNGNRNVRVYRYGMTCIYLLLRDTFCIFEGQRSLPAVNMCACGNQCRTANPNLISWQIFYYIYDFNFFFFFYHFVRGRMVVLRSRLLPVTGRLGTHLHVRPARTEQYVCAPKIHAETSFYFYIQTLKRSFSYNICYNTSSKYNRYYVFQ